jgi:hypothetical protein
MKHRFLPFLGTCTRTQPMGPDQGRREGNLRARNAPRNWGDDAPMKRRCVRYAAGALVGIMMIVGFARMAVANSSGYAFTMRWRYVSGKENRKFHALEAGELTLSGKVWITDKKVVTLALSPDPVTIEVMQGTVFPSVRCSASVTPDRIFNSSRVYSMSCGRIEAGTYWIQVSKPKAGSPDGDGWHSQGDGLLTTTR